MLISSAIFDLLQKNYKFFDYAIFRVSDDELLSRARGIYMKVIISCSFQLQDYQFISGLYTMVCISLKDWIYINFQQSSESFLESLSNEAVTGLLTVIYEKKAPPQAFTALFKFFSIVAVEAHSLGCNRPLADLNQCLDAVVSPRKLNF